MEHLVSYSLSGQFSSIVISTKLPENLWSEVIKDCSWTEDYLQINESAFFFSLGSDAVNQLITFYLFFNSIPEGKQCSRLLKGTFESKGEAVFLESIDDMSFTGNRSFFLPSGRYHVECRSWNLENGVDVFEPFINVMIQNIRHEIAFVACTGSQ
ncbi:MAG: hypothetical protein H7Y12_02780 [Sphingobacteriaceae bacterium]|nr:hypothetical protein [Cytophagaceae bacterium]